MPNKKRKCKYCKQYTDKFVVHGLNAFCDNMDCVVKFAVANKQKGREKIQSEKTKALKKKVRDEDRSYWLKKAQQSFNAYIRHRDTDFPCISCQRNHQGQYHAGHYRTVGGNPELRFDELNCHKQCSVCNNHLSGNITDYRINLVKKIGIDKVEWIEGPHEPKKYTIDDLKEIDRKYRRLVKDA